MKTNLLPLLFLLFCFANAFAGDKYTWPEYINRATPDSLKQEDAIFLENSKTIDFLQMGETSVVHFKRIRLLSKKGVEHFSERELYQFNGGHIALKKARVIKPSGEIIELGDQHIMETFRKEKSKYEDTYLRRIQFLFPNLEVGDVIDIIYQIDYDHYLLSNTIYLEDELVSLSSRLTLRNMSALELSIYPTRNMTDFTENSDGKVPAFSWNKTSVAKQTDGFFFSHPPNSSKITYTLWYEHTTLTYDKIYHLDLDQYSAGKGIGVSRFLDEAGVLSGADPMTDLMNVLRHLGQFDWITENEVSTSVKTPEYFKRSVINKSLYFRYLQLYLEEQKIPYQKGFTKSLLDGVFEHGYVSLDQLERRFLLAYDADGNGHFLFPPGSEDSFYLMDEIPFYCEGNQSVILEGNNLSLVQITPMALPESQAENNKHTANILLKINAEVTDSISMKRTDLFTGHYSYLLRGDNLEDWLETTAVSDTLLIPSDVASVYPYGVTFKQEIMLNDFIGQIDDSLYWFKPESLLQSGIFFEDETSEEIADYGILPFLKQDKIAVYVECTRPVSLAETTKTLVFSNEVGQLKVEVFQTNATTLKFVYDMKLTKRILSDRQQNEAFHQLLTDWSNARTKKWAIRF